MHTRIKRTLNFPTLALALSHSRALVATKADAIKKGAETTASIFALRNADPSEWRDIRNVQHDHSHSIAQLMDEQLLGGVESRYRAEQRRAGSYRVQSQW